MFLNELPTGWGAGNPPIGAAFSRFAFKEEKNYDQMLKNKGQPYNEDEINELQARINANVRRFLFDFYGNGSTRENEGFKIVGNALANDFIVTGGTNAFATGDHLRDAGRIFLHGFQILFHNELDPGDTFAELIGDRTFSDLEGIGKASPASLTTPTTGDRTDEVYLEFVMDEITTAEDADLQNPEIDADTIRMALKDWKVVVAEDGTTPETSYDGGTKLWTYRLKLAVIERIDFQDEINAGDVTDFRLNRWWREHGPSGEHLFDIPGFGFEFIQNIFRAIAVGMEANATTEYQYDSDGNIDTWRITDDGTDAINFRGEGSFTYNAQQNIETAVSYFADTYGFEDGQTPPVPPVGNPNRAVLVTDTYTYDGLNNITKVQRTVAIVTHTFFTVFV